MKRLANFSPPRVTRPHLRKRSCSNFCLLFLLAGCLSGAAVVAQGQIVLVGSGSTVPAPLFVRWGQEFGKQSAGIQMRYLPVGTDVGIKQISHGAGDFSAGEAQLTEKERKEGGLIELPVVMIAIVPVYNLPGVPEDLRLSGEVLAEIFLGEVRTWNAPQIAKLNPALILPSLAIRVVNRPAGKGSNYVFTDFLSKVSSRFRDQIGTTSSPKWPVGEAAERSSDMANLVKIQPGSIGYVEYQYAVKESIRQAPVLNSAGRFVKASVASITAACKAAEAPQWNNFSASLVDASGSDSFPITSFSWIYLRTTSSDSAHAAALRDLLTWIYSDGQQYAAQTGYADLPEPLLVAVRKKVAELK
jgi:phosphate transport system substrate-binding protein